ncbi:MAG TPA: dihydropteroate synthase, partial [Steroidobacteraceae bacterium]|nr:dihydropteroate synthase [Steroidobacteraceae bacterium]
PGRAALTLPGGPGLRPAPGAAWRGHGPARGAARPGRPVVLLSPMVPDQSMTLRCGSTALDLSYPRVMGILNVTPDSFSDAGRFLAPEQAVEQGLAMMLQGAAVIDVGGESTRPGAPAVPLDEELRRVVPVVERLARAGVVVSVDTSKPEVMRAAAAAGAHMINDVCGLTRPGALEAVAASGCAVTLMHMRGDPRTMQQDPVYGDVVHEVREWLLGRVRACREAGIAAERLVIDPGFGFGKTLAHNLELVRRLGELAATGLPVLMGMSRKSSIGALTGRRVEERLAGSLAFAVIAVTNGAHIIRAHDVAATVDALAVVRAVRGWAVGS